VSVLITETEIEVTLDDGRRIATPIDWYPVLSRATPQQRQNFELMPFGIHWPDIDEDISVEGMLRGARGVDWQRRIPAE
jgi:hypothetical protein